MLHNIVMSDRQIKAPVPMSKRFPFPNSIKGSKTKIYNKFNPIGILPIKNRNRLLSYFVSNVHNPHIMFTITEMLEFL